MIDDLETAIRLVENIKISNKNFSSTYMFTNENINGFIRKFSLNNKCVLTVCSSGDQAFNLILDGATKVDLFDIIMLLLNCQQIILEGCNFCKDRINFQISFLL